MDAHVLAVAHDIEPVERFYRRFCLALGSAERGEIVPTDELLRGGVHGGVIERTCDAPGAILLQREVGAAVDDAIEVVTLGRREARVEALAEPFGRQHRNRVRAQVRDELLSALESTCDVLMLPTSGSPVPRIAEDSPGLSIIADDFAIYTPIFNFTGLPAIQVPCGFDSGGLPVGFQIAGKPFDEATICQAAFAYEQAAPWHTQHPKL